MEKRNGSLNVTTAGRDLRIANGRVCIRLIWLDGGYAQEFYAIDSHGRWVLLLSSIHKNLIPSSEHRACASPMVAGVRPHLFAVCRESLRMVYSSAEVLRPDDGRMVVRLNGAVTGHDLTCDMTLEPGQPFIHVAVHDHILPAPSYPAIEYLMSSYAFLPDGANAADARSLDYVRTPILRPANDHVIGDSAFYSPAAAVQHGRAFAALVPDLEILASNRPMPVCLDLDIANGLLPTPLLSYGFCDYEHTDGGRHCRHDVAMSGRTREPGLTYGYYLLLNADCGPGRAAESLARFVWSVYGSRGRSDRSAQAQAQPQSPPAVAASGVSELESIVPDACASFGLMTAGAAREDRRLIEQARAMRHLALSAPRRSGLFPTAFNPDTGEWTGCEHSVNGAWYSTAECSLQLYWLLKLDAVERDERTLPLACEYADFLIRSRLLSGAVPAWYTRDLTVTSTLRSSAQTAASALLFAELARATGLSTYARACEQAAAFIAGQMARGAVFRDHTCFDTEQGRSFELSDPHSAARLLGTPSMLWTAQLFLELFRMTADRSHLRRGMRVMDELSLLQCVRVGPWNPEAVFGICQAGNCGVWSDAEITAWFARCAMRYGAAVGEKDLFDRGAAALGAALSAPEPNARSRAHIAAVASLIQSEFGCAFVHVGNRWAAEVFDRRIERFELSRGVVRIDLAPADNGHGADRVVFGGLKRESCRVRTNGSVLTFTRPELEAGVVLPDARRPQAAPPEALQLKLPDL